MQLIALKSFRNVPSLQIEHNGEIKDHVEKGTKLEIGTGKDLKACNNHDKALIAQLTVAGCVGDANDPKTVAEVMKEIEVEKKREAHAAKNSASAIETQIGQSVLASLQAKK